MTDVQSTNPSAGQNKSTTLKSGGLASSLTLQDINKSSVLFEISSSFGKFFKKLGFGKNTKIETQFAQCSDKGGRDYQEDAIHVSDVGSDTTLAILSDGMGGHAAGDVAARITVDTVEELLKKKLTGSFDDEDIQKYLSDSVEVANEKIAAHMEKDPETSGMGATLLAVVLSKQKLHWLSIGDSPLYLWRRGKFYQINQDHSMAPAIDQMAKAGMLSEEEARVHPDRNCLTSAMTGKTPELIDVGNDPLELLPDDLVILSSDGLQTLSENDIAGTLKKASEAHPIYIGAALLNSIMDLDDPEQDNIGIVTLKMTRTKIKKNAETDTTRDVVASAYQQTN